MSSFDKAAFSKQPWDANSQSLNQILRLSVAGIGYPGCRCSDPKPGDHAISLPLPECPAPKRLRSGPLRQRAGFPPRLWSRNPARTPDPRLSRYQDCQRRRGRVNSLPDNARLPRKAHRPTDNGRHLHQPHRARCNASGLQRVWRRPQEPLRPRCEPPLRLVRQAMLLQERRLRKRSSRWLACKACSTDVGPLVGGSSSIN
jgi:hypothetical protein